MKQLCKLAALLLATVGLLALMFRLCRRPHTAQDDYITLYRSED